VGGNRAAMATLIESFAGVAPNGTVGDALRQRAEIVKLSEAAHDAVLVPREPGGLSHALRAALAARMARHLGDPAAASHYDFYVTHQGDAETAPLTQPGSHADDPRTEAIVCHVDLLTLSPRDATRGSIEALRAAGVEEADIVRLSELAAFVNYQLRVVAGLRLLGSMQ